VPGTLSKDGNEPFLAWSSTFDKASMSVLKSLLSLLEPNPVMSALVFGPLVGLTDAIEGAFILGPKPTPVKSKPKGS